MIRTDVLVSSPIYLVGLVHILTNAGIKVVAERSSPDKEPSWLADALLIDADALPSQDDLTHITEVAKCSAVPVLSNETAEKGEAYLRAGAAGVISKREPAERVISAVRAITSGTNATPSDWNAMPVVERTDARCRHRLHRLRRRRRPIPQRATVLAHGNGCHARPHLLHRRLRQQPIRTRRWSPSQSRATVS